MEAILHNPGEFFFLLTPFFRFIFMFTFALLEGLPVVGTFFPGGTIAMFIGVLSNEGFVNPIAAILVIALGSFAGDMTGFTLGKKMKHKKWVKKIIEHEKHQTKWDAFDKNIVYVALFSRVVPFFRSIPSLFAGARNINTKKYVILSAAGSFIWAIGGVYGGNLISKVAGKFALFVILGILLISGLITYIWHKKK